MPKTELLQTKVEPADAVAFKKLVQESGTNVSASFNHYVKRSLKQKRLL